MDDIDRLKKKTPMYFFSPRTLLADRILTASTFDLDKERRHLELLKRRFGESQMHYCEVILKDVEDSGRINKHIQGSNLRGLFLESKHLFFGQLTLSRLMYLFALFCVQCTVYMKPSLTCLLILPF